MAQSVLEVGVNLDDKIAFEKFCNSVGTDVSACINLFIKTVLREKKFPFATDLIDDPFYSESNLKVLKCRIADMNARRNVSEHELIECDG